MNQPPIFRFLGTLGRALPYWALRPLIRRTVVPLLLRPEASRRMTESIHRRILSFQDKPATSALLGRMAGEREAFYAEVLANMCYLCQDRHMPRPAHPVELRFLPALRDILKRGKGAILASPHLGDQYTSIAAMAHADLPLHVLLAWGAYYRWLEFKRLRFHNLGQGAAALMRALKDNEAVFLAVDLDYFPGGRTADFFGAPVHPPHGTAKLSLTSGAPILPAYCVVKEGRYQVLAGAPIHPEGLSQEAIEDRLLRAHELFIGRYPSQWLIFHDMWDLKANQVHKALNRPLPLGLDFLQQASGYPEGS